MKTTLPWLSRAPKTVLAIACLAASLGAAAAEWPDRPITIVVGYAPGGANDVIARFLAEKLQPVLKQTIIVENRAGVASIVGAQAVARAKPDGYTLLMGASGPMVFNHALYSRLPYKPSDFAPISLTGTFPLVLIANKDDPARNVKELVDASIRNPERSNYGASAASFQLITELFNEATGAKFSHIGYKGSMESVSAVMSKTVSMTIIDPGPAATAISSGRARPLAVTSAERMKQYPDIPTMKELGIDSTVTLWSGLFAPANTPPEIVKRLHAEVERIVTTPDARARLESLGVTAAASSSPAQFAELIDGEIARWKQVAKRSGVKAD
ncbi:tripartite tricarboxylate transporter substrate binding protein [Variovorax sp. J22P271]|uniref:Bug family tripartite tricarboxylate transporter substrate binding protein n=1 Tax=Variovorax davisae TaxID=3053515 RepID=UPI0025760FE8|nr:tripartite tricarboxylate transporter substrate binding protein [Variovorax sp. J22P271]MDM0032031.1 tripartite tricarboxylate transporter substrate binding protein [Variovorax sp. J22P271]